MLEGDDRTSYRLAILRQFLHGVDHLAMDLLDHLVARLALLELNHRQRLLVVTDGKDVYRAIALRMAEP